MAATGEETLVAAVVASVTSVIDADVVTVVSVVSSRPLNFVSKKATNLERIDHLIADLVDDSVQPLHVVFLIEKVGVLVPDPFQEVIRQLQVRSSLNIERE